MLATASLVGLLPNVILGPFVGTPGRPLGTAAGSMLFADSIISLATVVLAVLFTLGVVEIWHIYAVLFIRSLADSFHKKCHDRFDLVDGPG